MSIDEREARRRIDQACRLIRSAYRLFPLNPRDTLTDVQAPIETGVELLADDLRADVREAAR